MKYIELTQGQRTKVDDDLFEWLSEWNWCAKFYPKYGKYYAVRAVGKKGFRYLIPMHRQISGLDSKDKRHVDHWNQDTLDNRRANLRPVTASQNQMNKRKQDNKTGFKGVRPSKTKGKFCATIKVDGKYIHLGTFDSAELAHEAYVKAANKHYKEYARGE